MVWFAKEKKMILLFTQKDKIFTGEIHSEFIISAWWDFHIELCEWVYRIIWCFPWEYPKWMVYNRKYFFRMDDDWGYPCFENPHLNSFNQEKCLIFKVRCNSQWTIRLRKIMMQWKPWTFRLRHPHWSQLGVSKPSENPLFFAPN